MQEETIHAEAEELNFSPTDFTSEELAGDVTETAESVENPEAVETQTKGETQEVAKHKIKYNGKEEEYAIEELITLAQKGRNYDHLLSERDALKNSEEMKALEEIATEAGVKDVKTLLTNLKENLVNMKLDDRAKKLEAEGMTPEHARRMAELELKAEAKPKVEAKPDPIEPIKEQFKELFKEFPETQDWEKVEDFPDEVQKMMAEGKSPLVAYTKYLKNKADEELRIAQQNKDASQRDTGSFKTGKSEEKKDDFLSGFDG